jgi:glycosyltransferase involved in cell wall biosynthesis
MKICIVVDDYLPDSIKVAAKMMHELACEFLSQGHEVTVITPSSTIESKREVETLDGVIICRFKCGPIKNVGKIKRAINETLLSYYAWKSFKNHFYNNKHDLIVYYSPSIFWGNLIGKLKKLWKAPSYLVLRDFFPQWAVDQGLIKQGSMIEKYFRYFENKNYDVADTIGVMSQKNLDRFQQSVTVRAKLEVLHNWASNTPVESQNYYKNHLGLQEKVVYFYGGNIGQAQDMMNIVRLAKNMSLYNQAHFVLVGAGDEVELVQKAIKEDNITNMTLLPPVNQNVFKQMLAEFDVGLFTLHKGHSTHNFPGKLLGYMVQKKPILGSINMGNDLKEIIESSSAGFVTINGEDELFLNNAIKLLDNKCREELGKNAYELLQNTFSVESATKKILEHIKSK